MAGYNLKEGSYEKRHASDDELWSALSFVFSSKSVNDTSYKFGFLKAIIDNLYNVDEELRLTFDQLFSKFGEIYWNLVLKHGLKQKKPTRDNRETSLERVLHYAVEAYQITEPIPYESLSSAMMIDISHRIKVKCKENVVGALFEDTKHLFYSFSKRGEWIQFNPEMYSFICKHKVLIEKLNYYEWAKFLEKVNEESVSTRLLNKIDESSKRNNLSFYRRILYEEFEILKDISWGDRVIARTWPKSRNKLEFEREYELRSLDNELLCKGISTWCVIDSNTRKVERGDKIIFNGEYYPYTNYNEKTTRRLRFEIQNPDRVYDYKVLLTDLDHNLHVNNAKYLDIIYNMHATEKSAKKCRISFLNEARLNETIHILYKKEGNENYYIGYVDERVCFMAIIDTEE